MSGRLDVIRHHPYSDSNSFITAVPNKGDHNRLPRQVVLDTNNDLDNEEGVLCYILLSVYGRLTLSNQI